MNALIHERFKSRLATAGSFDGAMDVLGDAVTELGFDGVDYAYLPSVRLIAGEWAKRRIFARNFPPRWERGWMTYGQHDPILPATFQSGLPVAWEDVKQRCGLTPAQLRSIDYLEREMGFPQGITVPIYLPQNRFAFVSAVSARTAGGWRELRTRAMDALMILAHTFHHVTVRSFPPGAEPPPATLSSREIECLRWAAAGKSAPTTALILDRSVDTVRRHLKRAMAKMGASTIAQAVAIGYSTGILES